MTLVKGSPLDGVGVILALEQSFSIARGSAAVKSSRVLRREDCQAPGRRGRDVRPTLDVEPQLDCPARGHVLDRRSGELIDELGETGVVAERSEEHTSELQSPCNLVCRLLLEKKKY